MHFVRQICLFCFIFWSSVLEREERPSLIIFHLCLACLQELTWFMMQFLYAEGSLCKNLKDHFKIMFFTSVQKYLVRKTKNRPFIIIAKQARMSVNNCDISLSWIENNLIWTNNTILETMLRILKAFFSQGEYQKEKILYINRIIVKKFPYMSLSSSKIVLTNVNKIF